MHFRELTDCAARKEAGTCDCFAINVDGLARGTLPGELRSLRQRGRTPLGKVFVLT